jgi:methylglutaconyl-CoA hydratase
MKESALRKVMLTGEKFTARQAQDYGLVNQVVAANKVDVEVKAVLKKVLQNGPQALAACKELLIKVPGMSLSDARLYTAAMIAELRTGDEGQEGLSAFFEKRRAEYAE